MLLQPSSKTKAKKAAFNIFPLVRKLAFVHAARKTNEGARNVNEDQGDCECRHPLLIAMNGTKKVLLRVQTYTSVVSIEPGGFGRLDDGKGTLLSAARHIPVAATFGGGGNSSSSSLKEPRGF